jgi:hypothetical protein
MYNLIFAGNNKYCRAVLFFIIFLTFAGKNYSQKKVNDEFRYPIKKTTEKIKIDGMLDEAVWTQCFVARDFHMVQPMDTSYARSKTEVMMTYDDNNIYVAAINYSEIPGKYIVESMRRDYAFNNNDNFFVCFDTYNDLTNGYLFGTNAAGAQTDATQADGGMANYNWDNKWLSGTSQFPDKWIFEAAIPFKTLRYKKGEMKWGINFSRLDLKQKEKSAWAPMPTNFATATLAYAGNLMWDAPPPEPKLNISLIPYFLGSASKDVEKGTAAEYKPQFGGDAKISVTSALNLDLTVNPDFSQVEVDQQVTNLSRFELFYPEKRQFFLENSDLFANFGFDGYRPFFSRRIGLNSPINFGARLSGKIDNKWRVGLMDLGTGENSADSIPAQNYGVLALQRYVFSRSNISAIFINRESLNLDYTKDASSIKKYNREAGLEYNLSSKDNKWVGKFFFHKSFTPDVETDDYMYAGRMTYQTKPLTTGLTYMYAGQNFNPEVGFMPRTGFNQVNYTFQYRFFVKTNWLLSHGPDLRTTDYFDTNWSLMDNENRISYVLQFLDRSSLSFGYGFDYVKLQKDFDPTNTGGVKLPAGSEYDMRGIGFDYMSTPRKLFTATLHGQVNSYFLGSLAEIQGLIGYRIQPYGGISLNFAYNNIQQPEPYSSKELWLIGPKIDITFTNKLFLATFIQFNNQTNNLNLNSRFQWRFAPASDIFLVYTENYFPEDLSTKNRAIVLKFTYWYNL